MLEYCRHLEVMICIFTSFNLHGTLLTLFFFFKLPAPPRALPSSPPRPSPVLYAPRGPARGAPPRRGAERPDSPFGGARVEPHLVRERAGGVEPAEHEAGVRYRGALAAPPVEIGRAHV